MNIITEADVKKFMTLLKAGLKDGKQKELKSYTSAIPIDGTIVAKDYYVSLEFTFRVNTETIEALFIEDSWESKKNIDDLLNTI